MNKRVPWMVWLVTVGGLVAAPAIILSGANGDGDTVELPILVAFAMFVLGFATVGALVASRHPSNPVGWLCAAAALIYVCAGLADSVVSSDPESVRNGGAIARLLIAIGESLWAVGLGLGATLLLLLFPDGRVPSSRWRPVVWAATTFLVALFLSLVLTPGPIQDYPVQNPAGIPGAAPALEVLSGIAFLGLAVTVPISISSLFFRFRNAAPAQRQQLKWLLFATALVGVFFSAAVVVDLAGKQSSAAGEVSNFLSTAALSFIPVGIGVAVLRHRLYDIDVIVNRALVYTGLTAVLALTYLAIIFGLQQALSPVTEESDLAIAASTLAVAALFGPVRRGIQNFIDRRFYRRKFDTTKTIEDFNLRLRDEVDLAHLSSRLVTVVTDTMQPAHVSVWLRSGHR